MLAPGVIEQAERRVGRTLCGKWHLDRVIGVGGMASVYEATHRNRAKVAIKLLHPALSLEEETRSRFLREGYVANTIGHPGAVNVLDDDTAEDGSAFLVMELLDGESVEQRAIRKGGTLGAKEALTVIDELLEVLAMAHEKDIVHRDIKPENLFITSLGQLKVLDFGIARLNQGDTGSTRAGSFMGTPAFSAPEQARGRWNEVDARTDLYAVGATLFTLLTGFHVHDAETPSEQLALAISSPAPSLASFLPDAPKDLVDLVDTALRYHKHERFQSARALQSAVRKVAASLPDSGDFSLPPGRVSLHSAETIDYSTPHPLRFSSAPMRVAIGVGVAVFVAAGLVFVSRYGPRAAELMSGVVGRRAAEGPPVQPSTPGEGAPRPRPGEAARPSNQPADRVEPQEPQGAGSISPVPPPSGSTNAPPSLTSGPNPDPGDRPGPARAPGEAPGTLGTAPAASGRNSGKANSHLERRASVPPRGAGAQAAPPTQDGPDRPSQEADPRPTPDEDLFGTRY